MAGQKILFITLKRQNFCVFTYTNMFLWKKRAEFTKFWDSRARLKLSAGHMLCIPESGKGLRRTSHGGFKKCQLIIVIGLRQRTLQKKGNSNWLENKTYLIFEFFQIRRRIHNDICLRSQQQKTTFWLCNQN